jgi:hypothetical protein
LCLLYFPASYSWFQWHVLSFRRGGKCTCLIEGGWVINSPDLLVHYDFISKTKLKVFVL